jgi:hypothetical protein
MEREPPNAFIQWYGAKALASFRYRAGIPLIERLTRRTEFSSAWLLQQQRLGLLETFLKSP